MSKKILTDLGIKYNDSFDGSFVLGLVGGVVRHYIS